MAFQYIAPRVVINASNIQTDENFTDIQLSGFFNQAISDMNLRLNINLPLVVFPSTGAIGEFTLDNAYSPLPAQYMMSAVLNYVSYAIKAQDSSSVEARDFFEKYLGNISFMEGKTSSFLTGDNAIYAGTESNYAEVDFTGNYFNPNGVIVEEE